MWEILPARGASVCNCIHLYIAKYFAAGVIVIDFDAFRKLGNKLIGQV